jgi:hypothetical protein
MNRFFYLFSYCISVICLLSMISDKNHLIAVTDAYPRGAGQCLKGRSSVGSTHKSTLLGKKVISTTLTKAGIKVIVDGTTIAQGGTATVSKNVPISLKVTGKNMKGINIRVNAPTGTSAAGTITPGSGLKINKRCPSPSTGITQSRSTTVSSYTSTIKFAKATTGVSLDITIVFRNTLTSAYHAYGKVLIDFQ